MKNTHLLLCLAVLLMPVTGNAAVADTVYTNAGIYGHNGADTIAVSDGKILYIGSKAGSERYYSKYTQTLDMKRAFIMPGFVDNHNHVFEAASGIGGDCELSMHGSLEDQLPYLKACREDAPQDQWVTGYGFSIDSVLGEGNERTPLEVLDSVFPDQPVVLMEQTSHSMWVNSVALAKAGIDVDTPDPQGGVILKDEQSGRLTGILLDNAGDRVMEQAWNSTRRKFARSYDGLMAGLEQAAKHGITTIGDGRLYWKRGWFDVWQAAEKDGDLTARVSVRPWIYPSDAMEPQLAYLRGIQSADRERLLVVDQVKMYSDGIFINGTAKLLAPYLDTYIPDHPYGINYIPPQAMPVWLNALDDIGYSAHIHAIGDGAIRESLNAIEQMRKQGSKRPYTLTHVELVNSKDVPRFEKLDVTADFQVGSDYIVYHEHQWAEAFLGARRARALMNLSAVFETGANVTLSSDWNVHGINPLVGIFNSLEMGKTGLPDLKAAVDAYTINAAVSLGLDKITGSLEVGKSADFAILDQDITQLKPEQIPGAHVIMTVLQGEVVFDLSKERW